MEQKSINELTDQELGEELKKRKKDRIFVAVLMGVLLGCAVWSATHKGVFLTFILLGVVFYLGRKNSGKVEEVIKEINARKV
jgi:asparagine N-glycosylation enzyme membrane subunit Stt3